MSGPPETFLIMEVLNYLRDTSMRMHTVVGSPYITLNVKKPNITRTIYSFSVRILIFSVHAQLCGFILKISLSTCRRSLHYDFCI